MPDTIRTLSALQTLLADNTAGDISAQDMRDVLVSVYGAGLTPNAQAPVGSDITGQVGQLYVCTIAGLSDHRNLTLPSAAAGERVGVYIVDGDASFTLILKGAASQTINGGSAATEWSRLFIANEVVIFVCIAANTWIVESDGRIPQTARMSYVGTDLTTGTAGAWLKTVMNTSDYSVGCVVDVVTNRTITWRRASRILVNGSWHARAAASMTDNEQAGWGASYGGAPGAGTTVFSQVPNHPGAAGKPVVTAGISFVSVPAGSEIQHSFFAATSVGIGARGLSASTYLALLEIF